MINFKFILKKTAKTLNEGFKLLLKSLKSNSFSHSVTDIGKI